MTSSLNYRQWIFGFIFREQTFFLNEKSSFPPPTTQKIRSAKRENLIANIVWIDAITKCFKLVFSQFQKKANKITVARKENKNWLRSTPWLRFSNIYLHFTVYLLYKEHILIMIRGKFFIYCFQYDGAAKDKVNFIRLFIDWIFWNNLLWILRN